MAYPALIGTTPTVSLTRFPGHVTCGETARRERSPDARPAPDGKAEVLDFSPLPDEDDDRFCERIVQALLQLAWPTG